jgi:hypothetical protein
MTALEEAMLRLAVAAAVALAAASGALADPLIARDGAGTVYQLNDDGTYAIVVTGEDGKTYLLSPEGLWFGTDEAAVLLQRFDAFLDAAFKRPDAPKVAESDWPKYKACLIDAFETLPISAQRIIVSGSDPRETFGKLKDVDPDSARALELADQACRKGIDFGG